MTMMNSQRTLSQRLTEGRIPVSEALHYAMSLAEALRKLHDAGKAHGAVSPASIALTATGLDLIPSLGPPAAVTPYTAPEVLQGQPADARSDVFAFGALVFEMLTGRRAFDGDGQTALTMAICNSAPPPSGSPAVDRLVAGCVAKAPAARWQRMQKIIMELKLLTVAARRADATPPTRGVSDSALRSEIQQLENRLTARLSAQEKIIAEVQRNAGDATKALHDQLAAVGAQLSAVQERPVQPAVNVDDIIHQINSRVQETIGAVTAQLSTLVNDKFTAATQQNAPLLAQSVDAAAQKLSAQMDEKMAAAGQQHAMQLTLAIEAAAGKLGSHVDEKIAAATEQQTAQVREAVEAAAALHAGRVDESLEAAAAQHSAKVQETVEAVNERIALAEKNMEEIRKHFATLQVNVAGDLHDFEQTLKTQSAAIESARTAMSQTDDLVERVVEALELLQSSVLDQHDGVAVN